LLSQEKKANSEHAIDVERAIAADESTATLENHVSMASSRIGNYNVGT
jgi:hypothetical protein